MTSLLILKQVIPYKALLKTPPLVKTRIDKGLKATIAKHLFKWAEISIKITKVIKALQFHLGYLHLDLVQEM